MKDLALGVLLGALAALGGACVGARLMANGAGAAMALSRVPPQALAGMVGRERGPGGVRLPAGTGRAAPGEGAPAVGAGREEMEAALRAALGPAGQRPPMPGQPGGEAGERTSPRGPRAGGGEAAAAAPGPRHAPRKPGEPLTYDGLIQPARVALVTAPSQGPIARVCVRDGQQVRAGATLFELEHLEAARRLIEAEAAVKAARALVETTADGEAVPSVPAPAARPERLPFPQTEPSGRPGRQPAGRPGPPPAKVDPETQLKLAELDLKRARQAVALATIRAPISGVIHALPPPEEGGRRRQGLSPETTAALPRVGMLANPNAPLCAIFGGGKPVVVFDVDETEIGRVYGGQLATIQPGAFPGKKLTGRVTRIGTPGVFQGRGSAFPVTVELISPPGRVRLGMSARVTLL